MKYFFKKIIVNIRPIVQIVFLISTIVLPSLLNISDKVIEEPQLKASQELFDYFFYFMWLGGDIAIGILFFLIAFFKIRKMNKDCNFNKGNLYKDYPYVWYYIGAKILGYSECSLILVPIYMQFKLVMRDTFNKYYCGTFQKKEDDIISIHRRNMSNISNEINLIIADTYPLEVKQIPVSKRTNPTILITRDNTTDHNRYDSPKLVQAVVNEVRNLPTHLKKINVFATTNPHNTMKIVSDAFKLGNRGNVDKVVVFQQSQTGSPRIFGERGKIVFRK
ncbi:MAG: hypothetical protein KH032_10865 [[Clostridium] spiroforme]|uniref:hypothetical protein n=1 Tax=Thomasclavelia spiroformis TaxID=29348 RepID=UPI001D757B65|nr:hypothetical protein [Thomasclavelia spiroformis]MBS7217726.1 hypothetical protein [Thomasclavelia spiroformis]